MRGVRRNRFSIEIDCSLIKTRRHCGSCSYLETQLGMLECSMFNVILFHMTHPTSRSTTRSHCSKHINH